MEERPSEDYMHDCSLTLLKMEKQVSNVYLFVWLTG